MKRRLFLERVAQIAAGLGFGAAAAAVLPPAEASIAPSAVQQAALTEATTAGSGYVVHGGAPLFPDLLERGIRQVYFSGYEALPSSIFNRYFTGNGEPDVVIAGLGRMPRQSYLNRLKRGKSAKRRRM